LADTRFVAVRLGRVDVPVADLRRVPNGPCGIRVVDEPRPETQLRDVETVRQREVVLEDHIDSLRIVSDGRAPSSEPTRGYPAPQSTTPSRLDLREPAVPMVLLVGELKKDIRMTRLV